MSGGGGSDSVGKGGNNWFTSGKREAVSAMPSIWHTRYARPGSGLCLGWAGQGCAVQTQTSPNHSVSSGVDHRFLFAKPHNLQRGAGQGRAGQGRAELSVIAAEC